MCIGTSATMSSAHDEVERAVAVARVGKLIFGEDMSAASIIDESLARATDPRINSASLGRTLKDAVLAPTPETLTDKDLYSHPLACWIETEIGLLEGEKLRRRPPMTLSEAGSALSVQTGVAEEQCKVSVAGMLSLMGRRENLRQAGQSHSDRRRQRHEAGQGRRRVGGNGYGEGPGADGAAGKPPRFAPAR